MKNLFQLYKCKSNFWSTQNNFFSNKFLCCDSTCWSKFISLLTAANFSSAELSLKKLKISKHAFMKNDSHVFPFHFDEYLFGLDLWFRLFSAWNRSSQHEYLEEMIFIWRICTKPTHQDEFCKKFIGPRKIRPKSTHLEANMTSHVDFPFMLPSSL